MQTEGQRIAAKFASYEIATEAQLAAEIDAALAKQREPASLEKCAEAAHEAKIESCYMKGSWERQKAKEPWDKPNAASPDQPWHDISRDVAKAVLRAAGVEWKE